MVLMFWIINWHFRASILRYAKILEQIGNAFNWAYYQ